MNRIKRVVALTLILFVAALVVVFMLENNQPATVTLLGLSAPQLPFAVYIIMALLVGWGVGAVSTWFVGARLKRRG